MYVYFLHYQASTVQQFFEKENITFNLPQDVTSILFLPQLARKGNKIAPEKCNMHCLIKTFIYSFAYRLIVFQPNAEFKQILQVFLNKISVKSTKNLLHCAVFIHPLQIVCVAQHVKEPLLLKAYIIFSDRDTVID